MPTSAHAVEPAWDFPDPAFASLWVDRDRFRRFVAARVHDTGDAEDVLQQAFLRAWRHHRRLRDRDRAVAWFYRILRRVIVDHVRARAAESRRRARLVALNVDHPADAAVRRDERVTCRCFQALLPTLPPRYAQLLRRVDLQEEPKAAVAADLKIARGTFDVALHRARQALRRELEVWCGACSRDACLACTCQSGNATTQREAV